MGHKVSDKWGKEWPATMSIIEYFLVVQPTDEGKRELNERLKSKGRPTIKNWPIEYDDVNRESKAALTTAMVRRKEPLATFMREAEVRKIDKALLALRTDKLREGPLGDQPATGGTHTHGSGRHEH